jgi:hypothetical protein
MFPSEVAGPHAGTLKPGFLMEPGFSFGEIPRHKGGLAAQAWAAY